MSKVLEFKPKSKLSLLNQEALENDDKIFMALAFQQARESSTCLSRHVGAVLVPVGEFGELVVVGFSGPVRNECASRGCMRAGSPSGKDLDRCRGIHAEQRALVNSPPQLTVGATIYITESPCGTCAKIILMKQVSRVVYSHDYTDTTGLELLKEYGVLVSQVKEEDLDGVSVDPE